MGGIINGYFSSSRIDSSPLTEKARSSFGTEYRYIIPGSNWVYFDPCYTSPLFSQEVKP
jgi:hypothetical protein